MKNRLIGMALFTFATISNAAPTVYTDEALYLAELVRLGYSAVHESFEDDLVWAASRNTVSNPGSTPSVVSQGIVWTSNYTENNIATGTVGGSAPDGSYAIYSLPHGMTTDSGLYCDSAEDPNIPIECFQNDGLKVAAESGGTLYAVGGRFDSNTGTPKVTFLLDGVDINANDTDNIDNWQREGYVADNWSFVGVIYDAGFRSAEVRELTGKDFQQVLLFSDDFTLAVDSGTPPPPSGPVDLSGSVQTADGTGLCAMVLASGQYQFSCNPSGPFALTDLPRENDGTVKRQVYVDGFFPSIDVLADSVDETVVMQRAGSCPSYNTSYDPGVFPDSAGRRVDISGSVLLQDTQTPLCAMVLANGQYVFSCDGSGSYAVTIPLDANGQFKLQVYADGFAPNTQRFDEFSTTNDVRMARALECQ